MKTLNSLSQQVQQVVLDVMPAVNPEQLQDDTDIFGLGLDSINAVRLIMHLQATFSVTFAATDINFSNFQTIDKIVTLIDGKLAGFVAA
jgi:acyl carrier protein